MNDLVAALAQGGAQLRRLPVNAQQQPFVDFVLKHIAQLEAMFAMLPPPMLDELVLIVGEALSAHAAAIASNARLLRDHPEQFAAPPLTGDLVACLDALVNNAQRLHTRLIETQQTVSRLHQQQHSAPPQPFDLLPVLRERLLICRYHLRERPLHLVDDLPAALPLVLGQAYHIGQFVQHVVLTMGRELIEYGQVRLRALATADQVAVVIFCSGIHLDERELETLFGQRYGRQVYLDLLARQQGTLRRQPEPGAGAALYSAFPRAAVPSA